MGFTMARLPSARHWKFQYQYIRVYRSYFISLTIVIIFRIFGSLHLVFGDSKVSAVTTFQASCLGIFWCQNIHYHLPKWHWSTRCYTKYFQVNGTKMIYYLVQLWLITKFRSLSTPPVSPVKMKNTWRSGHTAVKIYSPPPRLGTRCAHWKSVETHFFFFLPLRGTKTSH